MPGVVPGCEVWHVHRLGPLVSCRLGAQAKEATYPDWYEQKLFKDYHDYHLKTWGDDIRTDDLIQLLRPDGFRSEDFAMLAKAAGMRYVVPFLKHHGGYCLWDSSFTHRDSVEWGLRGDIAGELSAACGKAGLKYGAYVSLGEWNYPIIKDGTLYTSGLDIWTTDSHRPLEKVTAQTSFISGKVPVNDYSRDYLVPSIKELIDKTNPDMLWFDGEWGADPVVWRSPEIVSYFYDRAAARAGGMRQRPDGKKDPRQAGLGRFLHKRISCHQGVSVPPVGREPLAEPFLRIQLGGIVRRSLCFGRSPVAGPAAARCRQWREPAADGQPRRQRPRPPESGKAAAIHRSVARSERGSDLCQARRSGSKRSRPGAT